MDFVYFGSSATFPYYKLSNFYECEFELLGYKWPSSEHAYMAISRFKICDWHRFSIGGDLSTLENGFSLIFGGDQVKAKSKADWWGKKNMVGIIAKMASKPDVAKKLGLHYVDFEITEESDITKVFLKVLNEKFKNLEFKEILKSTDDKNLVEFDRGSHREALKGKQTKWTGLVKDGELYGYNLMGKILMQLRIAIVK